MPAVTPFANGFDAYHLDIARSQNPYVFPLSLATPTAAGDWYDGWDVAEKRELEKAEKRELEKAEQKREAQRDD